MTSKDEQPATSSVDATESTQADSSRLNPLVILRQMAEKYLRKKKINPPKEQEALSSEYVQQIVSELQTHQIELEMQNEELRQTQEELERSRARYFDLYNLAPVGYCTVSKKGLVLEANLTAANILAEARGVITNQPFSRFILAEDQDIFYLLIKQLFETGEAQSAELRVIRKDRVFFWVNLEATVGLDENGKSVTRMVLSNIDQRKQAEENLKKNHHQNQVILDSITDAFISLSDDMVVTYFNTAAEKILNRKRHEVIGRNLFEIFPEAKGSIFEENYAKAIRTKLPLSFETEFNVAPYQNWYGVRVYPSIEGITIYFQVITERKKAEEAKANLRLVKLQLYKAESLERMAGAIAHLFNNHLQLTLGNLELALDCLPANAIPRKYLINAIKANRRSSDVSGLLLTYLGQNTSQLETLDLSKICQQCLSGIEALIPSGISIENNFMSPGPVVHANASQLQQVLTILITNAWEAIKDATGGISVVTKTVPTSIIPNAHVSHIEWETTSKMFACLEVTDTGCGIVDEEMDKIFDPFYTTKFTGRGLGLAVAMSLVRAWDGIIHVKSEAQKGSCFRVFLPLAQAESHWQADLQADGEALKAEGTVVLLVDDDPVLCDVMEALLNHLGFSVFVAATGYDALTLFQKHHSSIDCLLTDLSMPGMDGWETLEALRKIKPNLLAILCSGYDEARAMKGDHKELPQAFLHKPYTKDDLNNVLNRVLGDSTRKGN
jgi:PAS domain S-box-containing protein